MTDYALIQLSRAQLEILRDLAEREMYRIMHDPDGTDEEVDNMRTIASELTRTIETTGWSGQ